MDLSTSADFPGTELSSSNSAEWINKTGKNVWIVHALVAVVKESYYEKIYITKQIRHIFYEKLSE